MITRDNFIKKIVLFVFIFLFSGISSYCADNSINGIDVQQVSGGAYNILLKLDKPAKITKQTDGNNNLTIVLNKILPSDSLEIIYDNADDLDNIIVQKKNSENTSVYFHGKNINNSIIYVKDLSTGMTNLLNEKNNSFFFISAKKFVLYSVFSLFCIFLFMLLIRPKSKRYSENNTYKIVKSQNKHIVNTLRSKNLVQSKNIPSINYNINSGFNNLNKYTEIPEELKFFNNSETEANEIRKAG